MKDHNQQIDFQQERDVAFNGDAVVSGWSNEACLDFYIVASIGKASGVFTGHEPSMSPCVGLQNAMAGRLLNMLSHAPKHTCGTVHAKTSKLYKNNYMKRVR